jgi:cytochrome P450
MVLTPNSSHGTKVPSGSVMLFLIGSANRDDCRFPDDDRFDIHRDDGRHLTFGNGIHLCMGAALARMEGVIALEELLATVRAATWSVEDRTMAAAVLDVLWSVASYERMVVDWRLDPAEATRGISWVIGLIRRAVEAGPDGGGLTA